MAIRNFHPLLGFLLLAITPALQASDLIRLGGSAKAQAAGGVAGLARDGISAFTNNPAFLGSAGNTNQINLSALYVDSTFTSSINEKTDADSGPGFIPEVALTRKLSNSRITLGAGVVVQSAMRAEFDFLDPLSTQGISYGQQPHESEFVIAKLVGGAAYQLNPKIAVGASLGIAYNRNLLKAPYTFQSNPDLAGLKVLVDLDGDTIAATWSFGIDYKVNEALRVSLAMTPQTDFAARGKLAGNLSATGLGIRNDFSYDARVSTALPESITGGATWRVSNRLNLGFQLDWVNWDKAFNELPISLSNGDNIELNDILGQDRIRDTAPLEWSSQRIIHVGADYYLSDSLQIRGGYEYSNAPTPRATATPMSSAILEQALTAGVGIKLGSSTLDIAYRLSSGSDFSVNTSKLLGGEYNQTQLSLTLHTLSISFDF